jgi:serine protease Do
MTTALLTNPRAKNARHSVGVLTAGAACLAAACLAWVPSAQAQSQAAASPAATVVNAVRGLPDFTVLVDAVGPSVVNIRTVERVRPQSSAPGQGTPDEQMLEFFRRFGIPVPPGAVPGPRGQNPEGPGRGGPDMERPRGVGSGFILSSDGFIMTNAHVVEGADQLLVTLPDKREFTATVVGSDRRTDVAVVKIEATGLSPVRIGDVNRLRVGEWVMAIGSPFGLENTVTAGIVSAKQRDTGDFLPFIQTDVAINPGNSGGPLINMRGEVIGINSQIYSRSGGFQGISFAIPIDEAVRVSDELRATGTVTRGRIGVAIDSVTKELAESLGLAKPEGALVRSVETGSPAARAGVEPGDIILKFGDRAIEKSSDLPRIVGNTKPGVQSVISVWRRGAARNLNVTVGTFEAQQVSQAPAPAPTPVPTASPAVQGMGLAVRELTAAEKREKSIDGGVVIQSAEGPAARAGLREGDVIVALGNTAVKNVGEFDAAAKAVNAERPINLLVRRGEWAQYALIRPENR